MRKIIAIVLILIVALNVVLMVSSVDQEEGKTKENLLSKSFKVEVKDVSSLFFSTLIKF